MTNQILDRRTLAIAGPAADASPEMMQAARDRAESVAEEMVAAADLPGRVTSEVDRANIPGQVSHQVQLQVVPAASGAGREAAAELLNSDEGIRQTVKEATDHFVDDLDLLRRSEIGAVRTVDADHPLYADVKLSRDFRLIGGLLRTGGEVGLSGPGYNETVIETGTGTITVTRDYRRAEPGSGPNGVMPAEILNGMASRIGRGPAVTSITAWGDSMSRDHGGLGASVISELSRLLGVEGMDRAYSGDTPTQVATRAGAFACRITLVDGATLPASGQVAVTVSPPRGWRGTRTWVGSIRDTSGIRREVRLVQDGTNQDGVPNWTLAQISGSEAVTILPGTRFKHTHADDAKATSAPALVWVGRNDPNVERGRAAVRALLSQLRDPGRRVILVSMFNRATEPKGSAGYEAMVAYNEMLAEEGGADFYDGRRVFIDSGLQLAGLLPTDDDEAAITQDTPPPSLLMDDTHPNLSGRGAFARILANEILGRNW